ncbi:flagellar export chaperone FliS [Sporolactobacillus pectinivorans]|uniref:flagellar export chaperone FliS n=1 Tax=Sporolactobacillus pectinivorans TaxID=1591408 RepID=UPI000C25B33D|nr:flagellar export chaperone FliS [Sporolactobacillus pectinivorans]
MSADAYKTYQRNTVLTAPQGELILLLFNGCIKFIRQARVAINGQDMSGKNTYLQKAQAIIRELMVTLDQNHPVSENIMMMYDYIHRRLIEANMKNDLKILDEAERLVIEFRDTWKQVNEITKKKQPRRDRA